MDVSRRKLDLMAKLTGQFDAERVLKYQVATEDLDALVSVRSDEDLKHMLDEIDRQEKMSGSGNPKLRTFLFPSRPTLIENQGHHSGESHVPEQRYMDAVNGIIRGPPSFPRIPPLKVSRGSFGFWSACTSPTTPSPKDNQTDHGPQEGSHGLHMHKVKSSPSLCSLGNGPSHPILHHPYHPNGHYLNLGQPHHGNSLHPIRSFQHPNRGHMGAAASTSYYYPPSTRYHRETGGGWGMGVNYDEYGTFGGWRHEKADSVPTSPRKPYWDGPYYRPEPLQWKGSCVFSSLKKKKKT